MPLDEAMAFVKSKAGTQFDPIVVGILEERYVQLDELARQQIEELEPLKTRLMIERGSAPGAGFEPDQDSQESVAHGPGARKEGAEHTASRHYDSLNLIAAASQEAKAVYEMSQMLGTSLSARDTSAMMSRRLQPLIPFDCFAVYLRSEESVMAQYIDGALAHAFSAQHIPLGEGLSGWVAQNERPIVNGNPTVEPNFVPESGAFTETSSALAVPLFDPTGVVFGVLTVYAAKHAAFSKDHLRILQAIQSKFSLSLENAFRYRTAETDARIDHLTQLVNMRYFLKQIDAQVEKARTTGHQFAVGICDLNSFKAVNDQYGHLVGNDLLRAIARGFRACSGPADTVARMGGDEFAFLFPSMSAEAAAEQLENLESAVQRACSGLRIESCISPSVGFAFFPEDGESAEELLGKADREMYLSKRRFYDRLRRNESRPILLRSSAR
jgi:diguanylate cyclase (GGDEF)-like protein